MKNTQNRLRVKQKRHQPTLKNKRRSCIICNSEYDAVAPMQKTCSVECRKVHYASNRKRFHAKNPDSMKVYNRNRKAKNPNVWKDKYHADRNAVIKRLGGKCCVRKCGVKNPLHLHIDYIPTMIGTGFRHPRHKKWMLDNIKDFRLICANHHYELTITGKIVGSKITQTKKSH